ncbi:MAG: tRNA uridine-5-carboxymethylaminomethyl(34) synthesis GTPase MnmE, partial [Desulfosarcinaceae bacterium]
MISQVETIAAVATAPGLGGIGIIRISGPLAVSILEPLFKSTKSTKKGYRKEDGDEDGGSRKFSHRQIHYGYILDPHSRQLVDEVLVLYMQAPHSYTREDVIEIQSHAGSAVLQKILSLVLEAGARLAEPGEFTRRAFLQGRIDLTQAEAVADLINAKTEAAVTMAARLLKGRMHQRVESIRQRLQIAAGLLEATIEFPEEVSNEEEVRSTFVGETQAALDEIQSLLKAFQESHVYRDGIQVSVVGRPNVGKSSLLNALLEKERAIVTALPGTTRDLVVDSFQINGIPIQIADTAGMRSSHDLIENLGIRKAKESVAAAQLVLLVLDAKAGYGHEDEKIYRQLKDKNTLLVINKADLIDGEVQPPEWKSERTPQVAISAKFRQNINLLKERMVAMISHGTVEPSTDGIVPNQRQRSALELAAKEVACAIKAATAGESEEFVVFHLQSAVNGLGTITGVTYTDDLLD